MVLPGFVEIEYDLRLSAVAPVDDERLAFVIPAELAENEVPVFAVVIASVT